MGATDFFITGYGNSAQEAFTSLVEEARHYHGHGGYTGTIAEKDSFVMIPFPGDVTGLPLGGEQAFAETLLYENDSRIDSKWGPAGCIDLEAGGWLFFGWASS